MSIHDAPNRKKLYVGVGFVLMTVATLNKGEFITLGARGYVILVVALVIASVLFLAAARRARRNSGGE